MNADGGAQRRTVAQQAAFAAGKYAERLTDAFFALSASLLVASDPRAVALAPATLPGHIVPVATVLRKDGSDHTYHLLHYLDKARTDHALESGFEAVWMAGALLGLGDLLARHEYFDHAPELELVYHLRNGIAHGNTFTFTAGGLDRLQRHPANNHLAWVRGDPKTEFEITTALSDRSVLFEFMGPGDVLDLLMSVGIYLIRMGNGDPLRPDQ